MTTVANLPAFVAGTTFRWRMASDNISSGEGWRVDTVELLGAIRRARAALARHRHRARSITFRVRFASGRCPPHHKRESQQDVNGCRASRSRLHS
jgi:hypothetical protein